MISQKELKDKKFTQSYQYEYNKWKFLGYKCMNCDRTIKNGNLVQKHSENCPKRGPKVYGVDPVPEVLLDVNRNDWKPFTETNQY